MIPAYVYHAEIVSIYDGDTVRADLDLGLGIWARNQSIRLYGIDTPEIRGSEKYRGLISRDWLRSQIQGKVVVIRTHKDKKGKYGRWLGVIYLGGRNINDELVALGLAERVDYS